MKYGYFERILIRKAGTVVIEALGFVSEPESVPFLPDVIRQNLKDVAIREMMCPWCKRTVMAAPWWTFDATMLDWYCPDCVEPIETVVLSGHRGLIDYFVQLWKNEDIF